MVNRWGNSGSSGRLYFWGSKIATDMTAAMKLKDSCSLEVKKTMAPHSSTLAWKVPGTEEPDRPAVHGVAKSQTLLCDFTFTFHFDALEKEMTTHSSVLAWRIPGTGEPGGLPSMGSHRVGHD